MSSDAVSSSETSGTINLVDMTNYREREMRFAKIFVQFRAPPSHIAEYLRTKVFHNLDCADLDVATLAAELKEEAIQCSQQFVSPETDWSQLICRLLFQLQMTGSIVFYQNQVWRQEVVPPPQDPNTQPYLSRPKPDFCICLRDNIMPCLGDGKADHIFEDELENKDIYANPHRDPFLLRYPSLVINVKSPSSKGTDYGAINQVGVSGSAAISMLRQLQRKYGDSGEINIVFSITFYGPDYKIWVHYQDSDTGLFCLNPATSRVVFSLHSDEGAKSFVQHLWAILKWTNGDFRARVSKWVAAAVDDVRSEALFLQSLPPKARLSKASLSQPGDCRERVLKWLDTDEENPL